MLVAAIMSGYDDYRIYITKAKIDLQLDHNRRLFENLRKLQQLEQRQGGNQAVTTAIRELMIIHGRNDPRVPVSEAIQTMDYIKGRGVDAQMLIYEDEGHGVNKLKNKLDCYPKMLEFVKKYMQLG